MRIQGKHYRSIWMEGSDVVIIDQRALPFRVVFEKISSVSQMVTAIREMHLRGAPLIGVAGAFGAYLAAMEVGKLGVAKDSNSQNLFEQLLTKLALARPTAVNLKWAIDKQLEAARRFDNWTSTAECLVREALNLCEQDVAICRSIGEHGLTLIREIAERKNSVQNNSPVNVLIHCNPGWIATIDYGTATAPLYFAQHAGIPVHVWVDETRPRLQGARLTSFELSEEGIPNTIIVDSAAGYLMQQGKVDLVLVGTDRTTRNGDVANKIGTYLKALAAKANGVPFYVALPSPSIDWKLKSGDEIEIEMRSEREVTEIEGELPSGELGAVRIAPKGTVALNPGFDVTPHHLVSGFITERGICAASEEGLLSLFGAA